MPERKGSKLRIRVNGKELESVTQLCYLGIIVTEDSKSECEVWRRIALAKEAFNKKEDLMCGSLSLQLKKMHSQSICMEYSIVWKWDMDTAKEWHKKDWSIWNVDLASPVAYILDGAQKEWWSAKNSWNKKENHGDTEDVEDMDYSQLTQGAGTGESKMVSMDNENLPIGQNTTAAAYII